MISTAMIIKIQKKGRMKMLEFSRNGGLECFLPAIGIGFFPGI